MRCDYCGATIKKGKWFVTIDKEYKIRYLKHLATNCKNRGRRSEVKVISWWDRLLMKLHILHVGQKL